jgi:four helix bundle protein
MGGITDLIVWREAALLVASVTEAVKYLTGPSAHSVADQMVRAAESIAANIAEGYGRGVTKDGARFFRTARSSKDELEGHLRVAELSGRLPGEMNEALIDHTLRVGYLVYRYELSIHRRMK